MSDFLYIDQKTRTNVEKTSQANISKDLFENYRIDRSLRFNVADSTYLSRTPSVAGNRKTWTFSAWAKRTTIGAAQANYILGNAQAPSGTNGVYFGFGSDTLFFGDYGASGWDWYVQSSSLYRDVSSWYHVVAQYDTTQATASERVKLYINGVRLTAFDGASTYPTLNVDGRFNQASVEMAIGRLGTYNGNYFNGYITEVNFIDGQALTPSSFGFFDNQRDFTWKPKKYSGSYGNNGFYLNFSNNSSASLLGKDFSGNGNNWTPNNFSVTAGAGNDSLVDSPTNYGSDSGVGGTVRGNYCTMNPLYSNSGGSGTYSNGNLTFSIPNSGGGVASFSVSSGKWYWEGKSSANAIAYGVRQSGTTDRYTNSIFYDSGGGKYISGTNIAYGSSWTTSDIIGVALDSDGGTITFYKNNVSQGSIALSTASITEAVPAIPSGGGFAHTGDINFGQRPFAYTAPTGFKALCTTNLPTPTIKKPSLYFDAVTYNGNTSTQTISGLGFSPDLVWLKSRSNSTNHYLMDSIRGASQSLYSNSTAAEGSSGAILTSFNSNGFSLGADIEVNGVTRTYVAWAWDESPIAGMDIVSYTGDGVNARQLSHNLGVPPSMWIVKRRNSAVDWYVAHKSAGFTNYLTLNGTSGALAGGLWFNSAPTSSFIYLGGTGNSVNEIGGTYIAYCFAEVEGFSKFGSYTGNVSTDGPFVYCGFRPRWVMIKRTDTSIEYWQIQDSVRSVSNPVQNNLFPDISLAEQIGGADRNYDFVSNGFKLRGDNTGTNGSGGTYIFAAFAESPFKNARAR